MEANIEVFDTHEGCLGPACKCHSTDQIKKTRSIKNIKNASKVQERLLGHTYEDAGFKGARRVPGSGAISILPGDIDVPGWFLVEAKQTRTGKMTINPDWYDKIENQAKQMGRPWWVLHSWTAPLTGHFRKLVTVPESTWFELLTRLKAAEDELNDK